MTDTPIFAAAVRAWCADYVDRACSTFLRSGNLGGRERCPMDCGEAS
jgi:hypothetical protein